MHYLGSEVLTSVTIKSIISGIYPCVVWLKSTYVLEDHTAAIFIVKEYIKKKSARRTASTLLVKCFFLLPFLAYSSTLKMEVVHSSKMLVNFCLTT
jgi:TRAP-type mannitol/chloroaromatic compound transport system permease small subunit